MTDDMFALVGGARDGGEVRIEGGLPAGAQVRFALPHDASRCEVYSLGGDGRLRFDGYAPALALPPDSAFTEELRSIIGNLGAALRALEGAYAARGLNPPSLQVNEWMLRRV